MTGLLRRNSRLYLLVLLLPVLLMAVPSSSGGEPLMPLAAGFTSRNNVNVRGTPSLSGPLVGTLSDRAGEELIVIGTSKEKDGESWYHILSESLGEGWISASFLRLEGENDPLWRFFLALRRDFGVNRAEAQKRLGPPLKKEERTHTPEDRKIKVVETELFYPDGSVIYWTFSGRDALFGFDFEGGERHFGPLAIGDDPDRVEEVLGAPEQVKNRVWTYFSGMSRIHICFDRDARMDRFIFERDLF